MELSHRHRMVAIGVTAAVIIASVMYGADQHLRMNARRAEAQLLLSYMATLQGAYYADREKFVRFEDWYGAADAGQERCKRPLGAAELGFLIDGCEKKGAHKPLYAFRSLVDESNATDPKFVGEAISGSDAQKLSLVCDRVNTVDKWQVDSGKIPKHVDDCK